MFTFLEKLHPLHAIDTVNPSPKNDRVQGDEFLFTLELSGLSGLLEAAVFWEAKYSGQREVGKYRLYDALHEHRRMVSKVDAKNPDREDYDQRVFTDVVIWIPEKQWQKDARSNGHQLKMLAKNLSAKHQEDFKNDELLTTNRKPQYCIMPSQSLKTGEAICQFGLSVFVPSAQDKRLADEVKLRKNGQLHAMPDWHFYEEGRLVKRPFGLYEGQNFLQFGGELETACPVSPVWFSKPQGYAMLNLSGHQDKDKLQQQYSDEEYVRAGTPKDGVFANVVVCPYFSVEGDEQLDLEIHLSTESAERRHGQNASAVLSGLTVIGAGRGKVASGAYLSLHGLALPKLTADLLPELASWDLRFDDEGNLLAANAQNYGLRLFATRQREGVWWQYPHTEAQLLLPPVELTCGKKSFAFYPPPVAATQYALLVLPQNTRLPLGDERTTLGRPDGKGGDKKAHHLSLNLLDKPDLSQDVSGKTSKKSLNFLHFSARHLGLLLKEKQLYVGQLSLSSPTYLLDQDKQLKQCLLAGSQESATLQTGDQLLVGCYWLTFEQEHV